MDGWGGCCLLRPVGDADVASKVERILLRFRPIAPKPASPGGSPPPSASLGDDPTGRRRGRRTGSSRRGRKRRACPDEPVAKKRAPPPAEDLVTLQLMPVTPQRKEVPASAGTTWASTSPPLMPTSPPLMSDLGLSCAARPVGLDWPGAVPAMSWLTLECVTETCWQVGEGRLPTQADARRAMEEDPCPAFLSDSSHRVAWTNAAYGRMVTPSGEQVRGEAAAVLVTKGRLPATVAAACGGFSCRLRVRCQGEKGSLTAPCDVWRLAEEGWLAWRLDVKAALSLGR